MAVGGSGIKGDNNQSSWLQASRFPKSQYMFSNLAVALVVRFMNTCTNVCMYNLRCLLCLFSHKQGIYIYISLYYVPEFRIRGSPVSILKCHPTNCNILFDKRGWAKAWSDCVCLHGAGVGMPCSKHFNQFFPSSCIPHCRNVQKRNGIIFRVLNSWSYLMFEHQGPKIGPRINLTWRWIVQHSATPWIWSVHHGHGSGGTCMPNFQHTVVIAASVFYS